MLKDILLLYHLTCGRGIPQTVDVNTSDPYEDCATDGEVTILIILHFISTSHRLTILLQHILLVQGQS